jgi:hypothetical protein
VKVHVGVDVGPGVDEGPDVGVWVHVGAGIGVWVDVAATGKAPDAPTGVTGATSKLPAMAQRLATVISAKTAITIKPSAK